ncbi:MAG: BamA/TamA family outer membrane protein [Leptospirales bacterium]|nr:BamA/TamA family outer membrane protein [Leptospirales bacterium]
MIRFKIIIAIIFLCVKISTTVDASDEQTIADEHSSSLQCRIIPFPICAYSPDTRFMGGIGAIINLIPQDQSVGAQEDHIKVMAYYTQNKQYGVLLENEFYFLNDFLQVRCDTGIEKFPSEYYGIGPDTPDSMKENYTYKGIPFFFAPLVKVFNSLYIGPAFDFMRYSVEKYETGGEIHRMSADSRLTKISGIGGIISYDTREDDFYTYRGELIEVSFIRYSERMGSDYNYNKFSINIKKYYKLYSSVICGQIYTEMLGGDIPFYSYPSIGGDNVNNLRGYLDARYVDKFLTNIQIEYRFPVIWRFGMALFAGIGEAEHKFSAFTNHPHAAGGAGVRFMIDEESKINLRLDFAYNGNEVLTYFNILEAF